MGKKPFTSDKRKEKDYEEIGDEARKLEEKYSADRGDAPDYEARLMVQKELAKKDSPLNSAYASGAGGMQYVSTAGAFQNLQDKISAGIQANIANEKAKKIKKKKFEKKSSKASDSIKPLESFTFDTDNAFSNVSKNF